MNRRIGFFALMVAALVAVLALARGVGPGPSGALPPTIDLTSASAGAAVAPARTASAEPEESEELTGALERPRHPEIGFRSREHLAEHYRKHGREFHAKNPGDYLRLAQVLRDRPRGGPVLEFVRNDAVTCRFDRSSGAFIAWNSDGTIRTFFRPRNGVEYFERQKSRAHEAP